MCGGGGGGAMGTEEGSMWKMEALGEEVQYEGGG